MKLTFKSLKLYNFMSFHDVDIEFTKSGYTLVEGINNYISDNASSNGSGKSSLWEAIMWCLTGSTIRGCKDIVNHNFNDGCYVRLIFKCDDKTYDLIRSKEHVEYKTNLFITIDDKNCSGKGIRDSEKLLHDYLPDITTELIGSVIILGQGLPQRFTNNTPAGRKDVLEKLSKSDFMIEDLKMRITDRKSHLSQKQQSNILKNTEIETQFDLYQKSIVEKQSKLASMHSVESLQKELQDIDACLASNEGSLTQLQLQRDEKQLEYDENNNVYTNLVETYNQECSVVDQKYEAQIESLKVEIAKKEQDIISRQKEITQLESISDICPTCKQKLPDVHKVDTTDKRNELQAIRDSLAIASDTLEKLVNANQEEKLNITARYEEKKSALKDLIMDQKAALNNLNTQINSIVSEISRLTATKASVEMQVQMFNDQKNTLETEIGQLQNECQDLQNKKLYILNENEELTERLAILSKFDTLVKRDFRGYLLLNSINYINVKAKEYCQDIFGNSQINFSLEGNNILITYDGKEYESLSGGERQKIDVIIQLSIRSLICKYFNFASSILVLDEITDNLDLIGCNNIINLISTKLHDVENVFVISHRKDLDIPYDNLLTIIKDSSGISNIVY